MKNNRLEEAKALLKTSGLSHLLISDTVDVAYISGFKSSNAAVLLSKRKNLLITDFRYKVAADQFCHANPEWKYEIVKERFYDTIASFIPEESSVGYQSNFLTVDNFNDLKKSLKKSSLKSASKIVSRLYLKKTAPEIDLMRKAAAIGDLALEKTLPHIKAGITEIELTRTLERYCSELGSEKPSFDTIVLFGNRAALPHGKPQNIPLKKGNWILIDFGCTFGGFCSDMTRTFIFGKASEKQKKLYNIVKEAQSRARAAARSEITARYLDSIARDYIVQQGYGDMFGHALGHGVGIRIHEQPRVSPHVDELLEESCVVTIEPGIYLEESGGVRIEDMVVLYKDKASVLTHFPRDLIEL